MNQSTKRSRSETSTGSQETVDTESTTLVSVRLPTSDVEALRLAAQAGGRTVAHHIRRGVQRELAALRSDPDFVLSVRAHSAAIELLISELNIDIDPHKTPTELDV